MAQSNPTPNNEEPIANLVRNDIDRLSNAIHERMRAGINTYGTPLQAFNGRDPLQDLEEELLDAIVYTRQAMEESYYLNDIYCELISITIRIQTLRNL